MAAGTPRHAMTILITNTQSEDRHKSMRMVKLVSRLQLISLRPGTGSRSLTIFPCTAHEGAFAAQVAVECAVAQL